MLGPVSRLVLKDTADAARMIERNELKSSSFVLFFFSDLVV